MPTALKGIRAILMLLVLGWAGSAWAGSTTTALTTSPNPSALNQSVTLTATVTGNSPSGTVTFKDGTNTLGTGTLSSARASLSYTFTAAGTHSLTAVYSGDKRNAASTSPMVSQTVNKATSSTVFTTSSNPYTKGQLPLLALTATVTGLSPTGLINLSATVTVTNLTGTVSFLDGTTTIKRWPRQTGQLDKW